MSAGVPETTRAQIERAVRQTPAHLLRNAGAATVLALLAAAALAPAVVAIAGGGAVSTAIGGIVGGIGAGQVTEAVRRCADRIRVRPAEDRAAAAEEVLRTDLAGALAVEDVRSAALQAALIDLVAQADGFEAAVRSVAADLRADLSKVIAALAESNSPVLDRLEDLHAGQADLGDQIGRLHTAQLEAIRTLGRAVTIGAPADGAPAGPQPPRPVAIPPSPSRERWEPGFEVLTTSGRYHVYDQCVSERRSPDGTASHRQAVAMSTSATAGRSRRFVWVRQVRRLRPSRAADATTGALRREHELLDDFNGTAGLPIPETLDCSGDTCTSVLIWPSSGAASSPCETLLSLADDGTPLSGWAATGLYEGLSGLCRALTPLHDEHLAHRALDLDAVVIAAPGRLALRDLGIAGATPRPGETTGPFAAPEQRRRTPTPPGPATDVYQMAAIAYTLTTGHPPPAGPVPPARAWLPELPEAFDTALAAAMSADPAARPPIQELAATFATAAGN